MSSRAGDLDRRERGERFAARRIAENYLYRPPYSCEVVETLLSLIREQPRTVLDAGCGPGKIARTIVDSVDRIDAVDPSAEMIRVGRAQPGGENAKIRWLNEKLETVPLGGPYALIVAGASFHWMNPEIALGRFSEVISEHGMFAVLEGDAPVNQPWAEAEQAIMLEIVARAEGTRPQWWMTAQERISHPLVAHSQFALGGWKITAPMKFTQPIADYLRGLHSRATFSPAHLGEQLCGEFDRAITALLSRHAINEMVTYEVQTRIDWGRPLRIEAIRPG